MPKYKVGDYFLDVDGSIVYEIKSVGEIKYKLNFKDSMDFYHFDIVERDVSRTGYVQKSKYRKNNKLNKKLYPKHKVIDEDKIEVGYEV